ncbi:MAG: metallophosphoesterase family protein [Planctomycetota bacterium]|nr:metallophosphoesterase family protein [Planctomycetota bacterium]MDA1105922.1 metallophosphoesterase family protein [Planctomycetota bacterium]
MVRRLAKAIRDAARGVSRTATKAAGAHSAARLKRAQWRYRLLTQLPDKLTGGKLSRAYRAMEVVTREWTVVSPHWPAAFDGLRIGHVTDLHAGELITPEHAAAIVGRLRAHDVDLAVCTGDVTDLHPEHAAEPLDMLGRLEAPLGAYLVLGNHDELLCADQVATMARRSGVKVLRNATVALRRGADALRIGGIEWEQTVAACAGAVDLTCTPSGGSPHLLLAHNPKAFRRAADLGVALTLSGHTHGAQLAIRKREPRFPRRASWRRLHAGPYYERDSHLYVSSGAGSWFPVRVNRPPEVVIITVKAR